MGYFWWQHTPGMSELRRLCKKDGGDKIYKVVHTDGYYDVNGECGWNCLDSLIESNYKYIEFHNTKIDFSSVIKELGYWRIYKSNKQDPLCDKKLEKEFDGYTDTYLRDFFKSHCLVARKLDKPESSYWFSNGINTWFLDKNDEVEMVKGYKKIEDITSHQIIANSINYLLFPYSKSALDYGLSFSCNDTGVEFNRASFPESILLPLKTKEIENDK